MLTKSDFRMMIGACVSLVLVLIGYLWTFSYMNYATNDRVNAIDTRLTESDKRMVRYFEKAEQNQKEIAKELRDLAKEIRR